MSNIGAFFLNSEKGDIIGANKSTVRFNQTRLNGVQAVGLASYQITYDIKNVNVRNYKGVIETATQSFPVQIPESNYTGATLATALQIALVALGLGAFTVVFALDKFTITAPQAIKIATNPFNNGGSDFFDMMGLLKNQALTLTNTSNNIVNLVYTDALYIMSEQLNLTRSKVDYNTNNRTNNVGVIYLPSGDVPKKDYVFFSSIKYIPYTSNRTIDFIDITIVDDEGNLLPSNDFKYLLEFYTL